jgi:hypothetical protein
VPETLGASSSMLGTALRVNYCETRCQTSPLSAGSVAFVVNRPYR